MRQAQRDGSRASGTQSEQWTERFERDGRLHSALEDMLIPNEAVELIAYGEADAAVIATPARVLIFKRGLKAGLPFSHRLKAFEFESVVAVNLRRMDGDGVLAIHAPLKVGSCAVYWLDERDDIWKARNALVVGDTNLDAFEPIAAGLRELMAEHHRRHGRATPQARPGIEAVLPAPARNGCTSCGAEVEVGWRYCPACGGSFQTPADNWSWPRARHGSSR